MMGVEIWIPGRTNTPRDEKSMITVNATVIASDTVHIIVVIDQKRLQCPFVYLQGQA